MLCDQIHITERQQLVDEYAYFDLYQASDKTERQFAFFNANIGNCLPNIPYTAYSELFRKMQLNRRLCFHDTQHAAQRGFLTTTGWDTGWASSLCQTPGIICTYHMGSYRYINYLLALSGVPISMVVSGAAYADEHRELSKQYCKVTQAAGVELDMELIDATQPNSLWRMAKAVRLGRSLLVYIDGNTGVASKGHKNLVPATFLSRQIKARQGVALLAYRLGVPIYPVVCTRGEMDDPVANRQLTYRLFEPIVPAYNGNMKDFIRKSTRQLYGILADAVRQAPCQWEGWLNIHQHLILETDRAGKGLPEPMEFDFATLRFRHSPYLLHQPTYQTYRTDWMGYGHWKMIWMRRLQLE